VTGPPGAGKTTLIASYIEARDLPSVWYQVDAGDADAATFFYYLRLAVEPLQRSSARPLELLTPEYMADLSGFSRRFFRDWYAAMAAPAIVVFDNFQDAPEDSAFVTVMREALAEIPDDITVVLCSRADPPSDFARFLANERMGVLDWDQLRLSFEETRRIAQSRAPLDDAELRELHVRSDGWAAGVTLMLEHVKRSGHVEFERPANAQGSVFDYFAGEIFNRASPEMQQLLVSTACSLRVTVDFAERVTGNPRAGTLLEALYRRHYFTYRRSESELSYAYHALFREFLLQRARALWSAEQLQAHHARAAALLEASGEIETAVELYLDAHDYDAAAQLILREADRLLAAGRWRTLGAWMRAFPAAWVERAPWLQYWWGTSLIPVDQVRARDLLEHCFQGMEERGDRVGQLLAAAGVIEAHYFEWTSFRPIDRWISAIAERLDPAPAFPSPDSELRVYSALLVAMSYRQPGNPLLPRLVERAADLLESDAGVNRKVTAGTFILGYCYFASDHGLAQRTLAVLRPLAVDRELTPLNQLWWRARIGYYTWHLADYDEALRALDEALQIADRYKLGGLRSAEPLLHYFEALVAFSLDDAAAADRCIRALARVAKPSRRFDMWYLNFARAIAAMRHGQHDAALEHAEQSLESAVQIGMVYVELLSRILIAHALVRASRLDEAVSAAAQARDLCAGTVLAHFATELLLIDAFVALARGDRGRDLELAAGALEHGKRTGYAYYFRWVPETVPAVFAHALAGGIEVGYVQATIRRFGFAPPAGMAGDWPYPLKLRVLGGFELVQDGIAIDVSKRFTRKPLELLKAIIALGGREIDPAALTDLLWPDAEGDAAQKALETTLHRLRKQLGSEHALPVHQSKIGIDSQHCWVDLVALNTLLTEIEKSLRGAPSVDALRSFADALEDLYPGDLLPRDTDLPWLSAPRQRLHARFLDLVAALGHALEQAGDVEHAISLYLRGTHVESAAEPLYQRLITCYLRTGRRAQAEEAYRHCLTALSAQSGKRPSAETELLRQAIQGPSLH
jgi:DNA-binding SARP family transcriptional activator